MCLNWKALDIYIFQTLDIACQEAFLKVDELSGVDDLYGFQKYIKVGQQVTKCNLLLKNTLLIVFSHHNCMLLWPHSMFTEMKPDGRLYWYGSATEPTRVTLHQKKHTTILNDHFKS